MRLAGAVPGRFGSGMIPTRASCRVSGISIPPRKLSAQIGGLMEPESACRLFSPHDLYSPDAVTHLVSQPHKECAASFLPSGMDQSTPLSLRVLDGKALDANKSPFRFDKVIHSRRDLDLLRIQVP